MTSEGELKKRIREIKGFRQPINSFPDITDIFDILDEAAKDFPDPYDYKYKTWENADERNVQNPYAVIDDMVEWKKRWLGEMKKGERVTE